jgi:malto-oligosyltrehalose trehalohydrolase
MIRRRHEMPFGCELRADGLTRFALWAPTAERVDLVLTDDRSEGAAMEKRDGGWFERIASAPAGTRYGFRIDGKLTIPDPASRANPDDVHNLSVVVDPHAFTWDDAGWRARPWHEAVIYELHVGTFSPEGTFAGAEARLDHLVALGVTVIELMPIADFPGKRGWGYDGVLMYAPDAAYGSPQDLKALICSAHKRGLAVMLDVVYNHFGPEGNYLHLYAREFFSTEHHTPWGAAINFDGKGSATVRDFYRHNTLFWLEEYHFDGLRFDAVHAFCDDSPQHILTEIAAAARSGPGRDRPIYLVLENHANEAHYLEQSDSGGYFDAQWSDDYHQCMHVCLTGETDGYYEDYAARPRAMLARTLAQGFAFQGELSGHAGGKPRGVPSAHLPPTALVSFLQNHDQIGNRAFGERLAQLVEPEAALIAAAAILLLAPQPPMLFMGEEWAAPQPFLYFCDFEPQLAEQVRNGRLREFAGFERFRSPAVAAQIPDPVSPQSLLRSKLDWSQLDRPAHSAWLARYRALLELRRREITPLIPHILRGDHLRHGEQEALDVTWRLRDGGALRLIANLGAKEVATPPHLRGMTLFTTHPVPSLAQTAPTLPPWSAVWLRETERA